MFTVSDLIDQVEIQGYVVVKEIKEDGNLHDVFGGEIHSLYPKYLNKEVEYMYCEDNTLIMEVTE